MSRERTTRAPQLLHQVKATLFRALLTISVCRPASQERLR